MTVFFIVCFFCALTVPVSAEDVSVMVDADAVQQQDGRVIVPVRIEADETIGNYYVELYYDNSRLSYVSGADAQNNGILTLSGSGVDDEIRYELIFDAISGGSAGIAVGKTVISPYGSDELLDVKTDLEKYITLEGEDVGNSDFSSKEKLAQISAETGVTVNGIVSMGGKEYYLIDLSLYVPDEVTWKYNLTEEEFEGHPVTFLTDQNKNVRLLYMFDQQRIPVCFALGNDAKFYSASFRTDSSGNRYFAVPLLGCLSVPNNIMSIDHADEYIVYAIDENGNGDYFYSDNNGILTKWEPGMESLIDAAYDKREESSANKDILIIIGASVLTLVIIGIFYFAVFRKRKKSLGQAKSKAGKHSPEKKKPAQTGSSGQKPDLTSGSSEFGEDVTTDAKPERGGRKVVISVRNVSMVFKAASSNVSGIKDFVVQKLKGKISRMMFLALDDISFDVYKGEVVGIIGTNGSGKSTLLKIVSGAMKPTSGTVNIKKEDVQLLTIGTGFDVELTARENVYLNGAIIGYSKEFIDAHYDEIVEFAELENFMDQQVKNFSSGMVSRLGFSIATVGNAAEILILDEVLAVGDEFFRKKSLARVKEMIHGGSTVLIVSHNMNTIMENCDKVIWLEKSRLRMIGDPEIVCKAYRDIGE